LGLGIKGLRFRVWYIGFRVHDFQLEDKCLRSWGEGLWGQDWRKIELKDEGLEYES